MKAYGGMDVQSNIFGFGRRGVVSLTPWPLYTQGKSPRYPLGRRLMGPRTGLDDVEKRKFLTLPGLELAKHVASRYTDYALPAPI
jgi:hypothetical protein